MIKKIHKVTYGSPDRPLNIGKLEIPCYVLEDGTRVLVQRGMIKALGMSPGGGRTPSADKLVQLTGAKALKAFISEEILSRTKDPVRFKLPNGVKAYGYEATLLPDICNVILEARDQGALQNIQHIRIAKQCEIIVRGLAMIGIIALIDEATGYQEVRDRQALQKILDKYITDKWAKWTKTFPDEFYKQLFRLKNMPYPPKTRNKPSYIGHWTNNIVYSRIAPGVKEQLKGLNPRLPSGNRARKHFQYMTPDYGTPELRKHLENLIFLMKGCTTWSDFYRKLNRAAPEYGNTMPLELPGGKDEGDG